MIWETPQSARYADLKGKKQHQSLDGTPFFVVSNFERNEVTWNASRWQSGFICKIPGAVITTVLTTDAGASSYDRRDLNLYNKESNEYKLWLMVCS